MSPPLTNRFVALGFLAAVATTLLGATVLPDPALTAFGVLARAAAYLLLVFAMAGTATLLGFLVRGEGRTTQARHVALRTAATALWLPPLLMFADQKSWFVLVIWGILVIEVAGVIAFVRGTLHDKARDPSQPPPEGGAFSVLKQDFPPGTSILGVLMIEGAIFGAVSRHDVLAAALYFAGTSAIAYRTLQLFQNLPALTRAFRHRILAVFMTAMFLVVLAWPPHIVGSGGSGRSGGVGTFAGTAASVGGAALGQTLNGSSERKEKHLTQGTAAAWAWLRNLLALGGSDPSRNSFAVARHILDARFPQPADGASTRLTSRQNTQIKSAVFVAGPVFAGVQLYPEVEAPTRLVAPRLPGTRSFGESRTDPLSIPFNGVYWFWRGPSDRPPLHSVVMHGSPSARFFRSTDGDGMSMEARQNLGFMVDPKRYGAIEISVENADPFPNTVSILLKIRNTTVPHNPTLSLGMEDVSPPASSIGSGTATAQVLRFRIPSVVPMGSFDELTVSYYLRGARSDRSARIAIDRFRLVPRGE
jgi:hypothetical protein